jgi:hypothetical protein
VKFVPVHCLLFIYLHATNPVQGHKNHQDIDIVQSLKIKYEYKQNRTKHYKI